MFKKMRHFECRRDSAVAAVYDRRKFYRERKADARRATLQKNGNTIVGDLFLAVDKQANGRFVKIP